MFTQSLFITKPAAVALLLTAIQPQSALSGGENSSKRNREPSLALRLL
jgi:hypothetical protein